MFYVGGGGEEGGMGERRGGGAALRGAGRFACAFFSDAAQQNDELGGVLWVDRKLPDSDRRAGTDNTHATQMMKTTIKDKIFNKWSESH